MKKRTAPRITLYGTTRCTHCHQAKQWLRQHGYRFQAFDIERNSRAFREYQRLGARGVPVMVIDGKRVDGFNRKRLQQLLG